MTRIFVPALALLAAACARNPATGERQLALVSREDEIALGRESAEQVLQTIGRYDDAELQAYVERIGMRLAKESERPDLPWSFSVLDDPTVNAFALPGGPVFVTRGILSYLTSEAELAAILGHEIAHITARHSVEQVSKAQIAQLGLGLGMIFSEEVRSLGPLLGAGVQLLFLKFGREDERQADALGFGYMLEQGYDPREMADVFRTLEAVSKRQGGGRLPEWLSTHPDPGDRAETAGERASALPGAKRLTVDRAQYLSQIDGIVFGENPQHGYMEGSTFVHPELGFQISLPRGWNAQNTPVALVATSPEKDAAVQLTVAGKLSPAEAARRFFAQRGVRPAGAAAARGRAFVATTQQGDVAGLAAFLPAGHSTVQVVAYTPVRAAETMLPRFEEVVASYRALDASDVQPARIDVVTVQRDMSVAEFARESRSSVPAELVALLNGLQSDDMLHRGQLAKRVSPGDRQLLSTGDGRR